MNPNRSSTSIGVALLLLIGLALPARVARAGLAPLRANGPRLYLDKGCPVQAQSDEVRYRILPDRVEARQRLVLYNPGPATRLWLGLPLPAEAARGPQDPRFALIRGERRQSPRVQRKKAFGWRPVAAWRAFPLVLTAGERVVVEASWWQTHQLGELHGYPRFLVSDPLWTSGGFAGPVADLVRVTTFEGDAVYSASQPDAEAVERGIAGEGWDRQERRYRAKQHDPGDRELFSLYYRLTRAAHSRCPDADPWLALDGDARTVWAPKSCPEGPVTLELTALCQGFGTPDPVCEGAGAAVRDLGLVVRTADGKARQPVTVEGFWGPHLRWRKEGRQNRALAIGRAESVTRYRISFPRGLGPGGAGEILLFRLDLRESDPGADRLLDGRGWLKANDRCRFELVLRNPMPLRHATLRLKPGTKLDAYMLSVDCADGRKRVPYHEPVPCKHTKEEIAEARARLGEPDLEEFHHEHFRRKQRYRIELDLDPSCAVERLSLVAPPVCTDGFKPLLPRLELTY